MSRSAIVHGLGQFVAWAVILAVAAALLAAVAVPRIGGATPYAVLTGSMRPALPPGTLVVVRPVPTERIGVGDVITYQLRSGVSQVITHRVVGLGVNAAGERTFTTAGDANDVADATAVRPEQVRGRLWYSVPQLGRAQLLLTDGARRWLVNAVAILLLGYALVMFVGSFRDHRCGPRHRAVLP